MESAVEHMNTDHATATLLMVQVLGGVPDASSAAVLSLCEGALLCSPAGAPRHICSLRRWRLSHQIRLCLFAATVMASTCWRKHR
jgi:hypothetical protein